MYFFDMFCADGKSLPTASHQVEIVLLAVGLTVGSFGLLRALRIVRILRLLVATKWSERTVESTVGLLRLLA